MGALNGGHAGFGTLRAACRGRIAPASSCRGYLSPQKRLIRPPPRVLEGRSTRHVSFAQDTDRATAEEPSPASPASAEPRETTQQTSEPQLPFRLVAGLAAAGAAITGYLAVEKLTGGNVACPASGSCETILSSGYATVLGIPLSLLGFLAYASVAGAAIWQALQSQQQQQQQQLGRLAVLGGGTALATTSSSLIYILLTEFPGQTCTWCLASALLSFSIFVAACSGFRASRELSGLAAPGGLTAGGVALFLAVAWNGVEAPQALANIDIPFQPTIVRTPSSPRAVDVARRLREAGARMYGAFWCSHCQEQKVSFGKEAQKDLPYVECFPEGYRTGVKMAEECRTANLQGFPLWIVNGHRYEGEQTLSSLEAALKKPAS